MKKTSFAVIAMAIVMAASTACRADDADKDKPINFSSDTGGYDRANGHGDLTGNATFTQGTLVLHADRITFKMNPDNTYTATAFGNPVTFRQKREGSDEYNEAYAQRIVYDGQKQLVELFEHALLKQGPTQEMRSDYISFNRATDVATMGTSQNAATAARPVSRVTGVILPKEVNAAAKSKDDKGGDAKANGSKDTDARTGGNKPDAPAPLPLTLDSELKAK
ncbi:MAG: lipopolysaccharide transport periplasmic protein LptA [Casimicrobiaceae bacterium]